MKKISVIGVGRLGLCFALNLEKNGFTVVGVDKNQQYITLLNSRDFDSPEPGVNELLKQSRIVFSTEYNQVHDSDIIFICVNTPSKENNQFSHEYIEEVMKNLVDFSKTIIIDSTTMPGYCHDLQSRYPKAKIVYNPEFIAQGTILNDQKNPDFILIGAEDKTAIEDTKNLYFKICDRTPIFKVMNTTEAEIAKLGLNCFITSKISMVNTIGDLAVQLGVRPNVILEAIGTDTRIGSKTMKYGFGFGGPCFPRDNKAFASIAQNNIMNRAIDESNKRHLEEQVKNFLISNPEQVIEINDVSYKPKTDIIECSQQLAFAVELVKNGRTVILNIPENIKVQVEKKYPNMFQYFKN